MGTRAAQIYFLCPCLKGITHKAPLLPYALISSLNAIALYQYINIYIIFLIYITRAREGTGAKFVRLHPSFLRSREYPALPAFPAARPPMLYCWHSLEERFILRAFIQRAATADPRGAYGSMKIEFDEYHLQA